MKGTQFGRGLSPGTCLVPAAVVVTGHATLRRSDMVKS